MTKFALHTPRPLYEGENEGAGGGSEAAPAPAPTDGNGFADISSLLEFDGAPPEPEPKAEKPSATSSTSGEPEGGTEGMPQPKETETPITEPGKEGAKPEGVQQPENTAEALKNLLKEVLKEGKETEPKPAAAPAYTPKYSNVQVPDAIFQAMNHEDPNVRRQGLNAFIGAAMSKVYDDAVADISARIEAKFSEVPQVLQQTQQAREAQEAIAKDFYGTYKQFDTPQGRQLTQMVAVQLAHSMGKDYKGWSAEFRDKVGEALIALTGLKAPAPTQAPNTKPAGQPPAQFSANGSARPAATGTKTIQDDIAETLGL